MVFAGKSPFKVFLMLVTIIVIVTAVSLVLVTAVPGFGGPHFGFPSQKQASSAMGTNVTKSNVLTETNIQNSGIFIKKTEAVYYNSTSITALVTENQMNSSQLATNLSNLLTNTYSQSLGSRSSFTYNSINVSIYSMSTGGTQVYLIAFHTGSFISFSMVYIYSASQSFSAKAFGKAIVSSMA